MGLRFLACRSRLRFPPPRSELQFLAWRSGARFRPCRPGSRFLARRSELRVLTCRAELTFPSGCPGRDFELRFQDRRSETNYPDLLELSILFRRLSGDALNRWDLRETRSDYNASDFDSLESVGVFAGSQTAMWLRQPFCVIRGRAFWTCSSLGELRRSFKAVHV